MPSSPPDRRQPGEKTLFLLTAATMLAECAVTVWFFIPNKILIGLGLHFLIVGVLFLIFFHLRGQKVNGLFFILLPATAFTGLFGSSLCFIACAISMYIGEDADTVAEWLSHLFDYRKDEAAEYVHDRIAFGLEEFDVAGETKPFQDILSSGTVLQKQKVLAKITRYFRPNLAPLLLQAIGDANAAVRIQAATALARIERDFMKRCVDLKKKIEDKPIHDPVWLELAKLYDDYAYAGLADADERHAMREKAIEIYEAHQYRGVEAKLALARLYLRHEMPEKTCDLLQELLTENPVPVAIVWYMEALFKLQRFKELRRVAQKYAGEIQDIDGFSARPEIENAAAFWKAKSNKQAKEALAHAD